MPIADGFPLLISAGAGYAARERGSGPIALARLAFGYRDYSYSLYGWSLTVTAR